MTTNTNEPTIEFINRDLLISSIIKWMSKTLKVHFNSYPLQWWEKHENMFPTFGFYARQIIGIVGSQIEKKLLFFHLESLLILRDVVYNKFFWTI
jgi:hypothetical protein